MSDKKLIERLKEVLAYDPETGIFTWKMSRGNVKAGSVAGCIAGDGYILIGVDGRIYRGHRLAFAFTYEYFPKEIDHKNRDKSDNRIKNLKDATRKENCKNLSIRSDNTSGIVGVSWHKSIKKWVASIRVDRKSIHLGTFTHKYEAIQARVEANRKYGFSSGHGLGKVA